MTSHRKFVKSVFIAAALVTVASSAHAGQFDYLSHMNPDYTNCVNNTLAQVTPSMRNQVQTVVDNRCNQLHPAFPQRQQLTSQQLSAIGQHEQQKAKSVETRITSIFGRRG